MASKGTTASTMSSRKAMKKIRKPMMRLIKFMGFSWGMMEKREDELE
jgi:hypothetical protein